MTVRANSLLAAFIAIVVPPSALAQVDAPYYWREWGSMMSGSVWGTAFWWVMPLLMMVFMVVACFVLMRGMFASHGHSHGHHGSGLRILGERFARGEISREEYDEKRKLLEDS